MFAEKVKELRKAKGLTQIQFAEQFNVANGTVGMWETGKREPDFETTQRIADFFGVSVDFLLGREGQKKEPVQEDEPINPEIHMIARAGRKMSPEQRQNLLKYAKYMFPEAFEDDDT